MRTDRDGLSEEPGFNPRVGRQISCSDFRGACFEINFSGRQRGFDGVLPELSMGWVDPRVGLGWVGNGSKICVFSGLGLGHGSQMTDVRKIHVVYKCNIVSSIDW